MLRSSDGVIRSLEKTRNKARSAVSTGSATGLALALAHRGNILLSEGFGWADRERSLRASAVTPFCLASIGKPFTATALLTLVDEGRLDLDMPASRYLSDLGHLPDSATVRLLGAHASGLPSLFEMFPREGAAAPPTARELFAGYGRVAFPPGSAYEYSNIGYAALGALAERLTGLPFGKFLAGRLLGPLRLNDSFFDSDVARLTGAAARYDELGRRIGDYVTATPPSGEVYASARDLIRFALVSMGGGAGHDQGLSARSLRALHQPVLSGSAGGMTTFGWFVGRTRGGEPVLFKDGGQPGVSTIMCLLPSPNLTGVVLANRTDNGELVKSLLDEMFRAVIADWEMPAVIPTDRPEPVGLAAFRGRWEGRVHNDSFESLLRLDVEPDGVKVELGGAPHQALSGMKTSAGTLAGSLAGGSAAPAPLGWCDELRLKLVLAGEQLTGRILAIKEAPGELRILPYVFTLTGRGR